MEHTPSLCRAVCPPRPPTLPLPPLHGTAQDGGAGGGGAPGEPAPDEALSPGAAQRSFRPAMPAHLAPELSREAVIEEVYENQRLQARAACLLACCACCGRCVAGWRRPACAAPGCWAVGGTCALLLQPCPPTRLPAPPRPPRPQPFRGWGHTWPGHFLPTDRVNHWSRRCAGLRLGLGSDDGRTAPALACRAARLDRLLSRGSGPTARPGVLPSSPAPRSEHEGFPVLAGADFAAIAPPLPEGWQWCEVRRCAGPPACGCRMQGVVVCFGREAERGDAEKATADSQPGPQLPSESESRSPYRRRSGTWTCPASSSTPATPRAGPTVRG